MDGIRLSGNHRQVFVTAKYMKSKALERAGEADRVKCCVQTDRIKDLIPALFLYTLLKHVLMCLFYFTFFTYRFFSEFSSGY